MKILVFNKDLDKFTHNHVRAISTSNMPGHEGELVLSFNFTTLKGGAVAYPRDKWFSAVISKDIEWEKE